MATPDNPDNIPINFTPTIQGAITRTLSISRGISILGLKRALSPLLTNTDPFAIALVYNNTTLDNSKTIAECGILAGANVQIVINVATGRAPNLVVNPINPASIAGFRERFTNGRIALKTKDAQPPNLKAAMRAHARSLVERGIMGMLVIPGPNGKQVIELDKDSLELLKALREHRRRTGKLCLPDGSDSDMLDAMTTILEHDQDADGAGASVEPEPQVDSASAPTMEDEQFRANVKTLLERIRKSAESKRAAMSRALMQ